MYTNKSFELERGLFPDHQIKSMGDLAPVFFTCCPALPLSYFMSDNFRIIPGDVQHHEILI